MWLSLTTPRERRTLLAGFLGYGLDGFDFMIYTFLIPTLLVVFRMSNAQAGYIAAAALAASAIGGWGAGVLADRFGRVRVLQWTVVWFAVFTFLCGFTQSYGALLVTRALQGFGFGGEWAVGSVLVAETIDARHRGRAVGLVQSSWAVGWAAAVFCYWGLYALMPSAIAWKILFWLGIAPALLVVYLRRSVQESDLYLSRRRPGSKRAPALNERSDALAIFEGSMLRTTLLASGLCCGMMGAYYSVTTWLPTYLTRERHLSVTGTSGYLLVLIAGSFCGYLAGAWLSDALGRRRSFMLYAASAALLVVAYTYVPITDAWMLALGFPLGFFLSGIFSGMGAFLAELYPSSVRGSGQGFCYSLGRAVGALFPAIIGVWSARSSLGAAVGAMTVAGYALVIAAAWALPETRGRALAE
jgi:MFS family permease